jgi:hypothetical protein
MKSDLPRSPPTHPETTPPANALATPKWEGGEEWLAAALQRHWPYFKTLFKEQYLVLTDEDLVCESGHENEFLEHLERATCRPRQEFVELIAAQADQFT